MMNHIAGGIQGRAHNDPWEDHSAAGADQGGGQGRAEVDLYQRAPWAENQGRQGPARQPGDRELDVEKQGKGDEVEGMRTDGGYLWQTEFLSKRMQE